ncbi:MAG TPA: ABC transporter permease [Polyangiaceae bacterium]|jgi:NitT/TauT family transport system permease protein|nr:ABC transporter permease [Polyangiaceae bacterium]
MTDRAAYLRTLIVTRLDESMPGTVASIPPSSSRVPMRALVELVRAKGTSWLLGLTSLGGLLAFWYLGTKYQLEFFIRFTNVPTPAAVLKQALAVGASTQFLVDIGNSLRRILLGFGVATALGVSVGLLIGKYQTVRDLLMPALEVLRPIPAIAWVPMSIMLWPDNEVSIVFITFIGAVFPILLNTVDGVARVDRVLLNAGRSLGASEVQLFWHIILPGVMPNVFTGLAVGMGVAWVSLIAAEMISGQFGVGYFTWEAYSLVNYPAIVLGMLTIGVLGLLCSGAIRLIGRFAMPWLAYVNGGQK